MTRTWLLLLACGLFAADSGDANLKALADLEGVWSFALVEVQGTRQTPPSIEAQKMIISKDGQYVVVQGPRITRGILTVDTAKKPMHYDVAIDLGGGKVRTTSGIFEPAKDTFKVCIPLKGNDRPSGFISKADSGLIIFEFKRESKDAPAALLAAARAELAGSWLAETYALDGVAAKADDLKKIKLVIDAAGTATASNDGKVFIASTIKLDPASRPLKMDITFTEGDQKGKAALGIYKIENGILTICRAGPGATRPTEFASKSGTGHTLMTYRLEKTGKN
jgi:uncharacterized protein (TIGR03067 family)